ncbi:MULTISPECIES: UvrD-helicase domain-containing protein [Shewanella]|uniref:UvrD-helicase domain-containing protein n=1 Tax=Shewanella TaxID=22 RepID=UPI000E08AB77|nr:MULTISPECIES: UvrD-helicase domain-containing protein [Shewanella]MCU8004138.1 UvrD-helicase domain-containing protein [Shewanella sp. SM96]SUI78390.1 Putative ATP-dependent DNA helicase yjcD [Shewanella baltica]
MSSSKLSKSNSKSPIIKSKGTAFFRNIVPSKIFNVSRNAKYPLVQPELNRKIAEKTNPKTLNYTTNIAKIMSVLRDREIVEYQHSLIKAAINNISEDTVDVDYIRIGLSLTSTDIDKLLDKDSGITCVKTIDRNARLIVKNHKVGNANKGFKRGDKRPFFTSRFELFADNDDYRFINVFLANPDHDRNNERALVYNCEIEFIPTRVSLPLISFMLYQFQSVLGPRRYKQLLDNALLLELHTGYIMYGVSQLFAFMKTSNNRVSKGECFPKYKSWATETTYIGDRYSHHLIGYDKTLKENKKFIELAIKGLAGSFERAAGELDGVAEWFPSQACSYRLESRERLDTNPISKLGTYSVKSLLGNVRLLNPRYLEELTDTELKRLVKDKSIDPLSAKWSAIFRRTKGKKLYYSFDTSLLNTAFNGRWQALLKAIQSPTKKLEVKPKRNYQKSVTKARERLKKIIKKQLLNCDSVNKIVKSKKPAIYVEGCPGAGKTRLIIERVRHLLEKGIKPSAICVLAFTNKAADEFRSRLNAQKLYSDDMVVSTFSSWCNSSLDKDKKLKVLSSGEVLNAIKSLIDENSEIVKKYDEYEIARRCVSIFSHMADFDNPDIVLTIQKIASDLIDFSDDLAKIYKAYNKYKEGKYRDFNDMLLQMKSALNDANFLEKMTNRYEHLIVDEIQDTNAVQWHIIKTLYNNNIKFFCVGDPAQSIYGFRGANSQITTKFKKKFEGGGRYQLTRNYRTTEPLVELTNILRFDINTDYLGSISMLRTDKQDTGFARVKYCDKFNEAVSWLINDLEEDDSCYENKLILCRYNKQVESIKNTLLKAGFDTSEGKPLQVLTFHKSKGLEAEHCYVFDPLFSQSLLSTYKEELCNTYVAFTRAKKALTIFVNETGTTVYGLGPKQVKRTKAKSIFLDLPEEWLEVVD